ncbi:hypothetical protein CYMTET_25512 [Cymbomonas tetramitiformis]|uniref:Uncharacterized protein n=1 Tax=Cymbomonas tetramitiformis TaxID=36881 RepID=A0AAE0KZ61_9CHLO|nr:hypothetical protein CYMTET_25512 [Cymbomonas tetramitiformis]
MASAVEREEARKREAELQQMNAAQRADAETKLAQWKGEKEEAFKLTENVRKMQAGPSPALQPPHLQHAAPARSFVAALSDAGKGGHVRKQEDFAEEKRKADEQSAKVQSDMGALMAKAVQLEDASMAPGEHNSGREELVEIMNQLAASSQETSDDAQMNKEAQKQLMSNAKEALGSQHREAKMKREKLEIMNNPEDKVLLERARIHEAELAGLMEGLDGMEEELHESEKKLKEKEDSTVNIRKTLNDQVYAMSNTKLKKNLGSDPKSSASDGNVQSAKSGLLLKMSQDAAAKIQGALVGRANGSQNTLQFKALGGMGAINAMGGGGKAKVANADRLLEQQQKKLTLTLKEKNAEIERLKEEIAALKSQNQVEQDSAIEDIKTVQHALVQTQTSFKALKMSSYSLVQGLESMANLNWSKLLPGTSLRFADVKEQIVKKVNEPMEDVIIEMEDNDDTSHDSSAHKPRVKIVTAETKAVLQNQRPSQPSQPNKGDSSTKIISGRLLTKGSHFPPGPRVHWRMHEPLSALCCHSTFGGMPCAGNCWADACLPTQQFGQALQGSAICCSPADGAHI